MKTCLKCKLNLTVNNYWKCKDSKDGLRYWCKNCLNKSNAPNLKRRAESIKKYGIGTRAIQYLGLRLALFVYDRANRKCQLCKSDYDLTIDHIDGQGRHYQEKGLPMNNHPDNLRVLCRKCHGSISGKFGWLIRKNKLEA